MDDKANGRRRGVWLGLLVVLLLALGGYAYAQSSSPSASTRADKSQPAATPSATPSVSVLAPTQTAQPQTQPQSSASTGSSGTSGTTGLGTTSTGQSLVLAPQATTTSGNGAGNGNKPCVDPASENASCPHTFGVRVGQSPLLYPGVQRDLPVTFSNPNNFAIAVSTYRVTVSSSAGTCPASNLQVPAGMISLTPGLAIAKNGSTLATVPIKLAATAPDSCQRVTFTITVDATAVKK